MSRSPREVVEDVRRMVAGEGVVFGDLFAEDGVLRYPFALPGTPRELVGRDTIREYHGAASARARASAARSSTFASETASNSASFVGKCR